MSINVVICSVCCIAVVVVIIAYVYRLSTKLGENRESLVIEDYTPTRKNPRLMYQQSGDNSKHCMIFKINDDDQNNATLQWSFDDSECHPDLTPCGYVAELHRSGALSTVYPPSITISTPRPDEEWTIGNVQSVFVLQLCLCCCVCVVDVDLLLLLLLLLLLSMV
jgi:hypothetical protein